MSAGFFLSVVQHGAERPNKMIILLYAGTVSLTVGVESPGVGLVAA